MDATPLTQVSVLVVEDHDDTRQLTQFILLDAGALVQTAASAAEARTLLELSVPDVVLLDLDLPGEDGYALLASIRSRATPKRVAVIAATAHVSAADRARALSAGCDAFLAKPFAPQHLVNLIASLAPREWR